MGNKISSCASLAKRSHSHEHSPWQMTRKKDGHMLRLWAEVFHVSATGTGSVKWMQISEDLVPVNITCIQDHPEFVFHITAYSSQVEKILDVKLVQPGTRLGQASECFVYWRDPSTGDTWGLNFTSPVDARHFRECCTPAFKFSRKASSNYSLKMETNNQQRGKITYRTQSTPASPSRSREPQCTCMTVEQLARLKAMHESRYRAMNSRSQTMPRGQKRLEKKPSHEVNGAIANCGTYDNIGNMKSSNYDPAIKSQQQQQQQQQYDQGHSNLENSKEQQTEEEDFEKMEKDQENAAASCQQTQKSATYKDIATQQGPSQILAGSQTHLRDHPPATSAGCPDHQLPDSCLNLHQKSKSASDMTYGLSVNSRMLERMLQPVSSVDSPSTSPEICRRRMRAGGHVSDSGSRLSLPGLRRRVDLNRVHLAESRRCGNLSPNSDCTFFDNRCYATTPTSSNGNSDEPEYKSTPTSLLLHEYERHLKNTLEKGMEADNYSLQTFESLLTQSMENLDFSSVQRSSTLPIGSRLQEWHMPIAKTNHPVRLQHRHTPKLGRITKMSLDQHLRHSSVDPQSGDHQGFEHAYAGYISDRGYTSDHASLIHQASVESTDSRLCYLTSSEISDEDRLSLTTAVSDEEEVGSPSNSPRKAGRTAPESRSFNCTGAVRKEGYLSVKKWLLRKLRQVELARKRGWKSYWVCLKGTTLLFYSCDESCESKYTDAGPKHLIIVDGAIMQPIPEHPKREYVFCLSTAFGDAYLFQASCQVELEKWIQSIHCACAAAFARHRGKTGTLHLLQEEIFRLDRAIETENKMLHMAELQLSVVPEADNKQHVIQQIVMREDNLERLHCEQFRLRCYMASLQNGELPNPKGLLFYVSRITKNILNTLGVFSVSSFHAYICARSPSLLNNLLAGRGATKRRAPMLSRSNSFSSRRSLSSVTVYLRDPMSVEEFLMSACNRKGLNPMEHFVRVKKRKDMADTNYFVPHRNELIETYLQTHEMVEICAKILYQVDLVRHSLDQLWGFSVEAELVENADHQDELCVYISRVEDRSYALQTGLIKGDEIMIINGSIVGDLDMMYIESVLQEDLSLCLMLRSSRTIPPELSKDFKCSDDIERLVVPPPPREDIPSEEMISGMIVPAPSWSEYPRGGSAVLRRHSPPKGRRCFSPSSSSSPSSAAASGSRHHLVSSRIVAEGRSPSLELDGVVKSRGLTNAEKLRKVIIELIDTEKSYVKHLNSLLKHYMEPLRSSNFLNQNEVDVLFHNILEIVSFQRNFLSVLEEILEKDSKFGEHSSPDDFQEMLLGIGSAFLCYANNFKLYSSFCAAHSKAQKYLHPSEGNQALQKFLSSCNPKQQHSCTLESYLIKPIQRILKYPLLLQQLRSFSPSQSAVCKHLTEALQEMEKVAEHINEMQRIHEEYGAIFEHLARVHDRSSRSDVDLSLGDLLYYGGVEWLNASDFLGKIKKGLELHAMCFVFKTGVVFLCKERLKHKKKLMGSASKPGASEVEIIRFQALIPVSEVQVRCPNIKESELQLFSWELMHLKSQNQKRIEKVYHLANRTIRQIIRDSVRNMSIPSTPRSRPGSRTLTRTKPCSFTANCKHADYDNLHTFDGNSHHSGSLRDCRDVKSEGEETSSTKTRPMLGKTPSHLTLSTTSTLSSNSSNHARLIQASNQPSTFQPQKPLGSPIWKPREEKFRFPSENTLGIQSRPSSSTLTNSDVTHP